MTVDPDWVGEPSHYEWSPSGYVFVDGYWDYPLYRRGLLFAPVVFGNVGPGYVYRPSIVLDSRYLAFSLFARPRYQHYYFGDYFDHSYLTAGIYPWFSFHFSRHGYDPLYAHTNYVVSRSDPQWSANLRSVYLERRDTQSARPPRTYKAYAQWAGLTTGESHTLAVARPLSTVAATRDFPVRMERVSEKQADAIKAQTKQVAQFRGERVKMEKAAARDLPRSATDPKVLQRRDVTKVKLPDVPHLGPAAGAKMTTNFKPPPAHPTIPEINTKVAPPAVKGQGRKLPEPAEIIKRPPPHVAPVKKGKGG